MKTATDHIPCYVINLRSECERRTVTEAMLSRLGITPIIFDAVTTKNMTPSELERHVDYSRMTDEGKALSNGEIGCALSHVGVYRDIERSGYPVAVVLEDDTSVDPAFADLLDRQSGECIAAILSRNEPEMVQMTRVTRGYRFTRRRLGSGFHVIRPVPKRVWLASGYAINLEGAKRLANALDPVWTVADHWGRFQAMGLVRLWALTPFIVAESFLANHSSLESARSTSMKTRGGPGHRIHRVAYDLTRFLWETRLQHAAHPRGFRNPQVKQPGHQQTN